MSEEISRRFFCRVALALPLFFVSQHQPLAEATPTCPSDQPTPIRKQRALTLSRTRQNAVPCSNQVSKGATWFFPAW
jgi:hypothetical protein